MRNRYLEALELEPGATEQEIKKAYRRLSKKYHPDLNKVSSSREKFIEITEAYDFLLDVGPAPHSEHITYDYDPYAAEYEAKRKWARERAEKYAKEKERNSRQVDQFLKVSNWVFFLITSIFILDIILPSKTKSVVVIDTGPHFEYQGGGYNRGRWVATTERYVLLTTSGSILLGKESTNELSKGDRGELRKTIFYGLSTSFTPLKTGSKLYASNPLFTYMLVFPLSALISSVVALRTRKRSNLWNFGSVGFILVPIFFYVINWYS